MTEWVWVAGISVGFALEPLALWAIARCAEDPPEHPKPLRGRQWLAVALMAMGSASCCLLWPVMRWVLLTVMVVYGFLWVWQLSPPSILD